MALAKSQQSLKKWTGEKWKTSDGKPSKGKKRYLPTAAWSSLTPAEKVATNKAKAKGNAQGKQFVKQPKSIAKKTARHRQVNDMAIKRSATSKDSDRARKARLEARAKPGSKGLKTTTGQRRAVVSDREAKLAARKAVGRYPQGAPARRVSASPKVDDKNRYKLNPVTVTRTTPKTKEQIAEGIARERYERLRSVLRPTVSPSRKKGGKVFIGPKRGSTVQVAKPSAATTRAKKVDPKDRKIDASRRTAMKAAEEARSKKTPAEREKEQRREKTEMRPTRRSSVIDKQQREADRRVREGLKAIEKAEKEKIKKPIPRGRPGLRPGGFGGSGGLFGTKNR